MSLVCPHGRVEQTIPCPLCERERQVDDLRDELARVTAERDELRRRIEDAPVGWVSNTNMSGTPMAWRRTA